MNQKESFVHAPAYEIPGAPPHWDLSFPLPRRCPSCALKADPRPLSFSYLNLTGNGQFASVSLRCVHCGLGYAAYYHLLESRGACQFLGTYPNIALVEVRGELLMLSPRFVKLYRQAIESEAQGNLDLAAVGMASAIAALLSDYQRKVLCVSKSKAKSRPMARAIALLPKFKRPKRAARAILAGSGRGGAKPKPYKRLKKHSLRVIEAVSLDMREHTVQKHA